MSADNGYVVSKIHNENNLYGIFYYYASDDYPSQWYTEDNAMQVWTHPVAAIIAAHRIQSLEPTEYGVHINALVLKDSENYFHPSGWRKSKKYGPC